MSAVETSEIFLELRNQAISSVVQCETIAEKVKEKERKLEESRRMFISLEKDFRKLHPSNIEANPEALQYNINLKINEMVAAKDELDAQEGDNEVLRKRLAVAFQIAKSKEAYLTKAQRELINLRVAAPSLPKANENDQVSGLEKVKMPLKDGKALEFYKKLSDADKKDFDHWHRLIFYENYAQNVDETVKHYTVNREDNEDSPLPSRPEYFLFSDSEKLEGFLASRVTLLAFQKRGFVFNHESYLKLRKEALKQLADEQNEALGREKHAKVIAGEVQIQTDARNWVEQERGEMFDPC